LRRKNQPSGGSQDTRTRGLWMSLLRRVGLTAARRSPMEAELCGLRSCVFTALAEVVWLFNALAIMLRESLKTISNKLTPSVRVERTVNPKPAVVELLNSGLERSTRAALGRKHHRRRTCPAGSPVGIARGTSDGSDRVLPLPHRGRKTASSAPQRYSPYRSLTAAPVTPTPSRGLIVAHVVEPG
jgi:hypothetical protein